MSHPALDEVQCPICGDTLKKPIRMLLCGHNLCHFCLVDLYQDIRQRKCPTCLKDIQLGSEGVVGLPRNLVIESVIDKLSVGVSQINIPRSTTSQSQTRLNSMAESWIAEANYQSASDILTALIYQNRGVHKVPLMVKKIKCLLNLNKMEEAKQVCIEFISIIESCDDEASIKETCDGCDEEIKKFAETFVEKKECDVGIGLADSLFKLIKCLRQGEEKLKKLGQLVALLRRIAKEMSNQNRAAEFKPQLHAMDEILYEIQNINVFDLKTRCLHVTWFMEYIGSACHHTDEYSRSIEMYKQAIHSMLLVFGYEARKHRVLGVCYHNLGEVYEDTNQLIEAKASFAKAIDVKTSATDYVSEDSRNESILISTRCLNRIVKKI